MAKIHFLAQKVPKTGTFIQKSTRLQSKIEATEANFDSIELGKKQKHFRDPKKFFVTEISAPEISTVLPARIGQILAFFGRFLKYF